MKLGGDSGGEKGIEKSGSGPCNELVVRMIWIRRCIREERRIRGIEYMEKGEE